jgi:hypothetical protein
VRTHWHIGLVFLTVAVCLGAARSSLAARIEADPTKVYHLRKKHGPWMIKVSSFSGETPEQRDNAQQAANQLVAFLRAKNIPAYLYEQAEQIEDIETYNSKRQLRRRHYTAQHGEIAVLAGNYPSVDDKVAQQTLKYIKKLTPKVTVQHHGEETQHPVNLAKAFLAPNPLLPAEELRQRTRDPLLLALNSGKANSLLENRGKYTLMIGSFYGKSEIKPTQFASFERDLADKDKVSLDWAAESAQEMAAVLRNRYKLEAFVYHERFRSIVTVGSYNDRNDPELQRLLEQLKAREKVDPVSKQKVLVGEMIHLMDRDGKTPLKSWTVEPTPQIMEVPRL